MLLEILFEKYFKFFDNTLILDFLIYYKNKTSSNSKLYPLICYLFLFFNKNQVAMSI